MALTPDHVLHLLLTLFTCGMRNDEKQAEAAVVMWREWWKERDESTSSPALKN